MILQGWKDIETSEGIFNWTHLDSEVARATAVNKIVRIAIHPGGTSVPTWVTQNDPEFKMNGEEPYAESEKGDILKKAFDIGVQYKLNWIEPWNVDILNTDLQD